jgi:hypothetical protein
VLLFLPSALLSELVEIGMLAKLLNKLCCKEEIVQNGTKFYPEQDQLEA